MGDGFVSMAGAALAVAGILILAYWCSRLLGKSTLRNSAGRSMKVIEQLRLGQDRQILLLQVGEQVYLMGVSQAGIQLLAQVEGDFEQMAPPEEGHGPNFREWMENYASLYHKKKGGDK